MIGKIHSIETFGTVDGPGIRYVLFMQGCPMRCAYCHNPDTWEFGIGEEKDSEEIAKDIFKYSRYIDGVTVSGGEPLLQIDFLIDLFQKVHQMGFTTCIDTSGILFDENNSEFMSKLDILLQNCDLVLLDIKHIDDEQHKLLTGRSNKNVLAFAKYLSDKSIDVWLRYVLVPGINSDEEVLLRWKAFADTLNNVKKIELLPYHKLGIEKYKKLGIDYKLTDLSEPTKEQVSFAKQILKIN